MLSLSVVIDGPPRLVMIASGYFLLQSRLLLSPAGHSCYYISTSANKTRNPLQSCVLSVTIHFICSSLAKQKVEFKKK